ncbi:MAG: hypothetical protein ACFE0P_04065 [Oceanicaulis sp.]
MRPDPIRDRLFDLPEPCRETVCDANRAPLQVHARNRLWMTNGAVVLGLALFATNADSIERWAASQPPNWSTETVRLTAGLLAERMALIGLDAPKREMRETWGDWREAEWEDVGA